MRQGLWTVILPEYFLHAAMADRLVTQAEVDDVMKGNRDGTRPGVVLAGLPTTEVTVQSRYGKGIVASLDDRDLIGP